MEKQVSKNQEQSDPESELDANVNQFGETILSVSADELRKRINQSQNTEAADSEE